MEHQGDFFCVDTFYGHLYASPRRAIEAAMESHDQIWLKDRPLWKLDTFRSYFYASLIVLPESEAQLVAQIHESGRTERLESVLADYRQNYARYHTQAPEAVRTLVVVNRRAEVKQNATLVAEWVWRVQRGGEV